MSPAAACAAVTQHAKPKSSLTTVMRDTPHTHYVRLDLATGESTEEVVDALRAVDGLGHGFDAGSFSFFWRQQHLWQVLNKLNRENAGKYQFFAV